MGNGFQTGVGTVRFACALECASSRGGISFFEATWGLAHN